MKEKIKNVNILFLIEVVSIIFGLSILLNVVEIIAQLFKTMGLDVYIIFTEMKNVLLKDKLLLMLVSQMIILIPMVVFCIKRKQDIKSIMRFSGINILTLVLLTLLTYTLMPVMSFINLLSMIFVDNKIANTVNSVVEEYPIGVGILVIAIIPAFVEELLCRGIIYNTHAIYNKRLAIVFSGLLFGILHGNFNQFAYAFFMGVVFALIIEATDSTISTIWCHFIINANSLMTVYVKAKSGIEIALNETTDYSLVEIAYWGGFAMIALCISIVLYIIICRVNKRCDTVKNIFCNKKDTPRELRSGILDIPLAVAICISISYMIFVEKLS